MGVEMFWEKRYIEPEAEWHDVKREMVVQGLWATHTHPEDTVADYEKMSMTAHRAGAPFPEIATIYSRYRVRG